MRKARKGLAKRVPPGKAFEGISAGRVPPAKAAGLHGSGKRGRKRGRY